MNKSLEEYKIYLENLIKEKSSVIFSNGGIDYASVLMSILLKNTKHSVHMFCEGFKPDLIKQNLYWNALKEYLSKKNNKLVVIINSDKWINEEPLKCLFEEQKNRNNDNSIVVYKINEEGRKIIKEQFNGSLNNFAIFDDNMYRLEYQPSEFKAFGSFNNTNDAQLLLDLFNKITNHSQVVDGTIN